MIPTPRELPQMSPSAALVRGMFTALVLFVPAAVLNLVATRSTDGGAPVVAAIFYLAILLGAGAGGWATIRLSNDAPLWAASAAPSAAYLIVQGVGVLRRLVSGDELRWGAYLFLVLLVATCGMLGGMFARRLVTRSAPAADRTTFDDGRPTDEGER